MNIAILIPELPGGGAERIASLLGNYYVDKGHNVYYFLTNNRKKPAYCVRGKIVNTEISILSENCWDLFTKSLIMRKYKMRYKIDVSISFMEYFNYLNVLSKGRDKVITRICTILSQRDDLKRDYLYNGKLIKFMYNHADKVVVMTNYAVNEMDTKYGVKRNRLVKIPNVITKLEKSSENSAWQFGNNIVICVGRLEDVKQHNIAIRAFSLVVNKIPDAELIILGKGSNENKLRLLINKLGLKDNVHLIGFKENINYYLEHSKIFLMTSKTEGFPNSMLEAMSMGIPVISIDSPGAPREILGIKCECNDTQYGKYGILTPYVCHDYFDKEPIICNEAKLADGIIELLSNQDMQKKYSEASYIRATMYDTEKIMNMWNKIIYK